MDYKKIITAQKMKFFIKDCFSKILQFPADLVTFTEEILNGKLHFLCCEWIQIWSEELVVELHYLLDLQRCSLEKTHKHTMSFQCRMSILSFTMSFEVVSTLKRRYLSTGRWATSLKYTSTSVFSCKFAAYFLDTFSQVDLWMNASVTLE